MTVPGPLPCPLPRLDRRSFLGAAAALPLARPVQPAPPARGPLSLAAVLEGAGALCREHLHGESPNDEAWVHGATALLARLDAAPPDPFGAMTDRERAFLGEHSWTFRRVHAVPDDGSRPAVITHQIHVAPGGRIALHDHRGFFGAIVGVDGEVEIRSFDVVDGGRDAAAVTLRETTRTWLTAGRFSLLTRARDNVHEFRAGPKGARLLDLFVWLEHGARSHDLAWVDDPDGAGQGDRRYRARWR